jgi:DNA-binding XRE family transcriptional regulator
MSAPYEEIQQRRPIDFRLVFAYISPMATGTAPFLRALGNCMHELRKRTGLNVSQLSEKSGLSCKRIGAIEQGEADINFGTLILLALALDTTVPEVFDRITVKLNNDVTLPQRQMIAFPALSRIQ